MRDLLVTVAILGSIPFILSRPYFGILVWSWISYMNPHRLTWGFAYGMPFAQIVGVATIIGLLFSKEKKKIPINAITVIWFAFLLWMIFTTILAIYPSDAFEQLNKILKIQFFTFVTIIVINTKDRINLLVWVIVLSIGFYGVKGGLFTLLTGGGSRVYGPPESFIGENNSLALATLMIMPLMYYLYLYTATGWVRVGLLGAMALSAVSVLGSHSRGAFIAGGAVAAFFWIKSKSKLASGLALVLLIPSTVLFMPDEWHERIATITSERKAESDDIEAMRMRGGGGMLSAPIPSRDWLGYWPNDFSALGRVNAWNYAINVANDRITGAGLESWSAETFAQYAPIVEEVQAAHSIFFSVLADHGWIGLMMFLAIIGLTWRRAGRLVSNSKSHTELAWAGDLSRMIQVSLLAYCTGGAFLSLAYYDLPWHLIAIVVLCSEVANREGAGVARAVRVEESRSISMAT